MAYIFFLANVSFMKHEVFTHYLNSEGVVVRVSTRSLMYEQEKIN